MSVSVLRVGSIVEDEWVSFEKAVLDPVNAGEHQRLEMKKAFFGGAAGLFNAFMLMASVDIPEEIAAGVYQAIQEELMVFAKSLIPTTAEDSVLFDLKPTGPLQ